MYKYINQQINICTFTLDRIAILSKVNTMHHAFTGFLVGGLLLTLDKIMESTATQKTRPSKTAIGPRSMGDAGGT